MGNILATNGKQQVIQTFSGFAIYSRIRTFENLYTESSIEVNKNSQISKELITMKTLTIIFTVIFLSLLSISSGYSQSNACLYVTNNPNSTITSVLNELGFSITNSSSIPSDMSSYNLVIVAEYSACNSTTASYVGNFVTNGGGAILLGGTPSVFCGGGYSTSCISDWFGTSHYSNVGVSDAKVAFNHPLDTSLLQNDVIDHCTGWGGAAVSNVSADATILAEWDYGSDNIYSFIRPYASGRVAFWAGSADYNSNGTELFKALCAWAGKMEAIYIASVYSTWDADPNTNYSHPWTDINYIIGPPDDNYAYTDHPPGGNGNPTAILDFGASKSAIGLKFWLKDPYGTQTNLHVYISQYSDGPWQHVGEPQGTGVQTLSFASTNVRYVKLSHGQSSPNQEDGIDAIQLLTNEENGGPYEPNDTMAEAYGPLTKGQWYTAYIETSDDIDWYKVTISDGLLTAATPIDLPETLLRKLNETSEKEIKRQASNADGEISGTETIEAVLSTNLTINVDVPSEKDYDLGVYNSSGSSIGSSTNGTSSDEQVTISVGDGTYYIKIWGYNGDHSTSNSYRVKADWHGATSDINLTCDVGSHNYFTPTNVAPGGTFTDHFRVKNTGTNSSGSFKIFYYLSTNTSISNSDTKVGESNVSSISAGSYRDVITTCTIPNSMPQGNYWVGEIIDPDNIIQESNENDNDWYHGSTQLTVNPTTHTVSTPNTPTGPSSGQVGQTLTFSTGGASCSQGGSVEYRFDWGSGNYSAWNSSTSASHSYNTAGTYTVKAQARCSSDHSVVSDWSTGKNVSITNISSNIPIAPFIASAPHSGSEFEVQIIVGSASYPVSNLYGVSFELHYTNTNYIDYVSYDKSGSFLGTDLLVYDNDKDANGYVAVGLTRKGVSTGVSGHGSIIKIIFAAQANTPDGTPINFSVQNVSANDPNGNAITLSPGSITTTIQSGLAVWPGDTNNDGIVNQADILPLGIHWAKTGPARTASNKLQWVAQQATPWTPNQNATYADANGDGTVNQGDILPIGVNWGKSHSLFKSFTSTNPNDGQFGGSLAKSLHFDYNSKQICLDIEADLVNLFGLSFKVSYPKDLIQFNTTTPGNLFSQDALFYQKNTVKEAGTVAIAITQKGKQPSITKKGVLIRLYFAPKNTEKISDDDFGIQMIQANDKMGIPIALSSKSSTGSQINNLLESKPTEFRLFANYPNPFNPVTTISYALPKNSFVTVQIFDLSGRLVRTLANSDQESGFHSLIWDSSDDDGNKVASGVYICQLKAGQILLYNKLTLTK